MKKIFCMCLVCGVSLFAIAGCGGRPAAPPESATDDTSTLDPSEMDAEAEPATEASGGDTEGNADAQ